MLGQATMSLSTKKTTRNAATMQACKTSDVNPLARTFVGGIIIKEGSTSARVISQYAPKRLRDLKGKGKIVL